MSSLWLQDYQRVRSWSASVHLDNDRQTFDDTIDSESLDLSRSTRVYSDFFVPATNADALASALEVLGYNILFVGAKADPTFVHSRYEWQWTRETLHALTPKLLDLCAKFDAGYDGSFVISLEEDDFS